MNERSRERTRERIAHAAVMSAIVGPMMAQAAVGALARLQNFFCPLNFLPIYAVSFLLLAPGFYLIGRVGAMVATTWEEQATPRWKSFLVLAVGGGLFGLLYFQALALLIAAVFKDYAPLLALPGLSFAISTSAAIAANWSILFGKREVQAFSLR
jgi:hypothetical protein